MKKNKKSMLIYTIFISLISTSVFAKECFVCGNTYFPAGIAALIRNLYNLVKLLVPIIIIIMVMIDLLKSVIASDEKKMAEATPKLIKKLIAGVTIFLIFTIVQFVFKNLLGSNDALSNSLFDCVTYFISEEPEVYECPTREDNLTDWINSHTGNSSSNNYSCYQCNSDSSKYLWSNSNPGTTTSCPAGYHTINKSKSDCKSTSSSNNYSCYQCNSDSSKYLWSNSNPGTTTSCPSGYHTINKSESDCK